LAVPGKSQGIQKTLFENFLFLKDPNFSVLIVFFPNFVYILFFFFKCMMQLLGIYVLDKYFNIFVVFFNYKFGKFNHSIIYKSLRTCLFEFFRTSLLDGEDSSFNVLSESIIEPDVCEELLEFCAPTISTGTDESVLTEEEPTPFGM